MTETGFTLRLTWQNDEHSVIWELQTEHAGFNNWALPVLFANRIVSPHPEMLELVDGVATLGLDTGTRLEIDGSGPDVRWAPLQPAAGATDPRSLPGLGHIRLSAWRLKAEHRDRGVIECDSYSEFGGGSVVAMSAAGLDGTWRPTAFEVVGPTGHVPVGLELRESGEAVLIGNHDEPPDPEGGLAGVMTIAKVRSRH